MGSETLETDSFLAMIANKIALLQALADSYRAARDAGALGQPGESGDAVPFVAPVTATTRVSTNAPVDLPTGAFRGMGMAPAVRFYLGVVKRKQTMKQIAVALKAGGLETTTADTERFERSLNTTLYRLRSEGVLLRFPEGWDLAEAYPEQFRQRLANKERKPTSKKGKTVTAKVKKSSRSPAHSATGPTAVPAA